MALRVSVSDPGYHYQCSCGCLRLSPSEVDNGGTRNEEEEPAEVLRGKCRYHFESLSVNFYQFPIEIRRLGLLPAPLMSQRSP